MEAYLLQLSLGLTLTIGMIVYFSYQMHKNDPHRSEAFTVQPNTKTHWQFLLLLVVTVTVALWQFGTPDGLGDIIGGFRFLIEN